MKYIYNQRLIKQKMTPTQIILAPLLAFLLIAAVFSTAFADPYVFASTNEQNTLNGWAHVEVVDDTTPGEVTLKFISTRSFYSCFEYRTDGDTSQAIGDTNYNPNAEDLYPYTCKNNNSTVMTFTANEYVEVRMVFGAESDERFDWTRFDVGQYPMPETKNDCKKGGWMNLADSEGNRFKNQGDCVSFVATGGRNLGAGN